MSERAEIIETAKRVIELDAKRAEGDGYSREAVVNFETYRAEAFVSAPQLAKAVIEMAEHDQLQRELCNKAIEAMVQRRWRDLPPLMLALQKSLYYESLSQPPAPGEEAVT